MSGSILLVHGAGSGPWVFDGWAGSFPGLRVEAVDLHADLAVASASMDDYASAVVQAAAELARPLALCGWSMGGLVALRAALRTRPERVVVLEPSPPAEVQGFDPDVANADGTFDPEDVYGPFPRGVRARPESSLARSERRRGVSVPSLPCPTLVVYGDEFAESRGRSITRHFQAAELYLPGLGHWSLVLDPDVPAAIAAWLARP